ncbi:MAG TPA: glutamate--tRNA ligase, partial [Candidatus Binataceae bacterium]
KFYLRIDDTDRERSSKESLHEIVASLKWLGLDWDDGPPNPALFQSNRIARYHDGARRLLREGKAYPCYCTAQELEAKRRAAEKEGRKPGYDGTCRGKRFDPELELPDKRAGRNYTIRFRSPDEGETAVDDLVKGRTVFQNSELDDLIIVRSDGLPTYNFATVIDDSDFEITHVVRGDDHLPNTPRQIQIFEALGLRPPAFAHLPMVLGHDGKPLSKRHGSTSVFAYRDAGYFPETLVNYLVRLGWSHGDQEIFSKAELVEFFDFAECGKSAGVFNQEKILWLNFHYLKQRSATELVPLVKPFIQRAGFPIPGDDAWLAKAMATLRERAKTLVELAEFARFYLVDQIAIDPKAAAKFLKPEIGQPLRALTSELGAISGAFDLAAIQVAFERVLARFNLKLGQLAQPVRVAITGGTVSPGIYEVIDVLGRERTVERLTRAIAQLG